MIMKRQKFITIIVFNILIFTNLIQAQKYPKREMRAVWVATVWRIDYPSSGKLTSEKQQKEFTDILDFCKSLNMNTIVVQIRPNADAFYPSSCEPWSRWLTGVEDKAPDPIYDPLLFMINEAHKRQIEFHAWINPFRASTDTSFAFENHPCIHKDWIVRYENTLLINPGIKEARSYVIKQISMLAKSYDIDAIHLDDYFYPYISNKIAFPDSKQHSDAQPIDLGDWRRSNIDDFVQRLHDTLVMLKPNLKFGVSPFGIWRNKKEDVRGSETNGNSSYQATYADVLKWIDSNWVDYVTPQLYWYRGHPKADYTILEQWWSKNIADRHLYIGHAVSSLGPKGKDANFKKPEEIPMQIILNRANDNVKGSFFYSYNHLKTNHLGITDSLKNNYYKYPAFVPTMIWKDKTPPDTPKNITTAKSFRKYIVSWKGNSSDDYFYAVYKFGEKEKIDIQNIENLYVTTTNNYLKIPRKFGLFKTKVTYIITSFDRMSNESSASAPIVLKMKK